jgi:hypothetical protein
LRATVVGESRSVSEQTPEVEELDEQEEVMSMINLLKVSQWLE